MTLKPIWKKRIFLIDDKQNNIKGKKRKNKHKLSGLTQHRGPLHYWQAISIARNDREGTRHSKRIKWLLIALRLYSPLTLLTIVLYFYHSKWYFGEPSLYTQKNCDFKSNSFNNNIVMFVSYCNEHSQY